MYMGIVLYIGILNCQPERHIFIHNWSLQIFNQNYDLAFHTTYAVCVDFIHEYRDLQIFDKLFISFLFTLRALVINMPRGSCHKKYVPLFPFVGDNCPGV